MAYTLPKLDYAYDALEPHIDARTMEIHHTKHHAAYIAKLNDAIKGSDQEGKKIEDILKDVSNLSPAVRNNGGGFYNHSLFWKIMGPNGGGTPEGEVAEAIQFEGEGCTISQGAASILVEMVQGKPLAEIQAIDYNSLIEKLGREVVLSRVRCATLGLSTLQSAIQRYYEGKY